jgi:hypothetical protein
MDYKLIWEQGNWKFKKWTGEPLVHYKRPYLRAIDNSHKQEFDLEKLQTSQQLKYRIPL